MNINKYTEKAQEAKAAPAKPEQTVATVRGERAFAAGDRVMFLRNDRGMHLR